MTPCVRLLLTSGNGPAECRIALDRLKDEIRKEADRAAFGFEALDGADPDGHGPASALVILKGQGAASLANSFCGTVKFTFRSPVRPGHKRRNWFVGVSLLNAETARGVVDIADVRFEAMRAGGPGGQHQNTTDSAVRAVHVPTGLVAVSREERSQHRNKANAVRKLEAMLALRQAEEEAARLKDISQRHKELERGNEVRHYRA